MKLLALLVLLSTACTVKHVQPTPRNPSHLRAEVLHRQVAWISDSVPILRFEPFYVYFAWKAAIESCAGVKREGMPAFFVAPVSPLGPDGRIAFYAPDTDVVVFALGWEKTQWIVSHEMLHFVLEDLIPPAPPGETLQQAAARAHPAEYFGEKCGHLVQQAS